VKNIQINGFIYPGLIDLHDHITWNFLPRWRAEEKFNNRYEWQARDAYLPALSAPHYRIVYQENLACDANQYGEVKAIVGGATSVLDAIGPDNCIKGLARNLDSYSGLYPPGSPEQLWNKVFPLEIIEEDVG
jgi:5-methylthioadenosine/S-adenosylhomocysteine deaminase